VEKLRSWETICLQSYDIK